MKDIFKALILEFQEVNYSHICKRFIDIPRMPSEIRKALIFIGMRRSGKTWLMYQQIQYLLSLGVRSEYIVYINFEDDRLLGLNATRLQDLINAFDELYPAPKDDPIRHFFLDEIQEIDGWEKFVRRLLDTENVQLYITGSSAKMLSKEIATALRGRTLTREVFPLSFCEYINAQNIAIKRPLAKKKQSEVLHHLEQYRQWGGFPEIVLLEEQLRREVLQNYVDVVIYRDIIERHQITNIAALKYLVTHCLQNAATLLSVNKIHHQLKSRTIPASKNLLYELVDYLTDAYCILTVPSYEYSIKQQSLKPRKIYPIDTGLITAFSINPSFNVSAQLETLVFLGLRRIYQDIYYYHTKNRLEVDFAVKRLNDEKPRLYQACISLKDEKTRRREFQALTEAMRELGVSTGYIITYEEQETVETTAGIVEVMPLWSFLIG